MSESGESGWRNVARILHVLGGLRAANNPGPIVQVFPTFDGKSVAFDIPAYQALISKTCSVGLAVIGCDFIDDEEELRGLREVDWRPVIQPIGAMMWPAFDVQQAWANIGHAAAKTDKMSVFEKARHIATQIRICVWRLRDLSETYHRHLRAVCTTDDFKVGSRFSGRHSEQMFISAHAMFSELASLRDHLATFLAREILGIANSKVDSWARLSEEGTFERSNHPAAAAMKAASAWLGLFGEYRNLFVHNAPLSEASGVVMVSQIEIQTKLGAFPAVSIPLPGDPKKLRDRLRAGEVLKSYADWLEITKNRETNGPDTLTYCSEVFTNLIRVAHAIAAHSPVPGQMMTITDADVIGEIKVSRKIIGPIAVRVPPATKS